MTDGEILHVDLWNPYCLFSERKRTRLRHRSQLGTSEIQNMRQDKKR